MSSRLPQARRCLTLTCRALHCNGIGATSRMHACGQDPCRLVLQHLQCCHSGDGVASQVQDAQLRVGCQVSGQRCDGIVVQAQLLELYNNIFSKNIIYS